MPTDISAAMGLGPGPVPPAPPHAPAGVLAPAPAGAPGPSLGPMSVSPINLVIIGVIIVAVLILVIVAIYTIYRAFRVPDPTPQPGDPGAATGTARSQRRVAADAGPEAAEEPVEEEPAPEDVGVGMIGGGDDAGLAKINAQARDWARGDIHDQQQRAFTAKVITPPKSDDRNYILPPSLSSVASSAAPARRAGGSGGSGAATKKRSAPHDDNVGEKMVSSMAVRAASNFTPPDGGDMRPGKTYPGGAPLSTARRSRGEASEILSQIINDVSDEVDEH